MYEDFVSFLSDKDYEYETSTEKELADLINHAEDEYAEFKDAEREYLERKDLYYDLAADELIDEEQRQKDYQMLFYWEKNLLVMIMLH